MPYRYLYEGCTSHDQFIGASSTDAITIDTSTAGTITLDFTAANAYINNLQSSRIINNGTGEVAIGLIFSAQIIGVGNNVGLAASTMGVLPEYQENNESYISVLGAGHKLMDVNEEEEDSSTLNTVVPVMVRTIEGWEFKRPLRSPVNTDSKHRRVDWL